MWTSCVSSCAISTASATSRFSRSLSSSITVSISRRSSSASVAGDSSVVAAALIAVSGVRSSWVIESIISDRNRSLSFAAASPRVTSSSAWSRSSDTDTSPPIASSVSTDSATPLISSIPRGLTPVRSGTRASAPTASGAGSVSAICRSATSSRCTTELSPAIYLLSPSSR